MQIKISIDRERIIVFCQKWKIKELSIFGSALRDDFGPDSDVDVLVVFEEDAGGGIFEHLHAEEELSKIIGRKVDLITKNAVRNPFHRHHILNNREVVYAA